MPEQRNPYATTDVPLEAQGGAQYATAADPAIVEYSTFWRRVGALFLDGLILLPLSLLAYVGLKYTRLYYLYYFMPGLLILGYYAIYLVKRNGGTPGKRILDLKVVMLDGTPVTTNAAIIRYSVQLILYGLSSLGLAIAGFTLTDAEFQSLGYLQKIQALSTHAPGWNAAVTWSAQGWYVVGAIVMLCNDKRRALHDFLAGTVVIRTG
ncbi:MAG TPA: RDD family protein [Steroidobacteraceae bacterium]|nr:RDD family protein [Steroidobacteraceae bacterium]